MADEGYIRESIENPTAKVVNGFNPIMPTFQGQVTAEQLIQIISYIKSLQVSNTAAPGPAPAGSPVAEKSPAPLATPQHNPK